VYSWGTIGSSGAVYSWVYHWFKGVISGRKNIRLEEAMKINESSDTKIVSMHHTRVRIGELVLILILSS
jgi:hypothetical protein